MRGFLKVKAKAWGMSDGSYSYFLNEAKREDTRTADAKRRFKTPAYYFGDRRQKDDEKNLD